VSGRALPTRRGFSYKNGWKHGRMARKDPDAYKLRRGARRMAKIAAERDERSYFLGFARGVSA